MRISMAQMNLTVGDLRGNLAQILAAAHAAREAGQDLLVTPELALCGYPPRDLCHHHGFVRDCGRTLAELIAQAPLPILVGAIVAAEGDPCKPRDAIANAAVLMEGGRILACHHKRLLPNYDVFDEMRYFAAGERPTVARLHAVNLGITICEEIWNDKAYWPRRRYRADPLADTVAAGADVIINLSASPYDAGKAEVRAHMVQAIVQRHKRPLLYVNQVGGNDGLIFDGRSMAVSVPAGEKAPHDAAAHADAGGPRRLHLPPISARAPAFSTALMHVSLQGEAFVGELAPEPQSGCDELCQALCLGLLDYLRKCGFDKVILGLSGGIDSAVCAALAVRALGADKVLGVAMPSRYSSQGSLDDAMALAKNLGIRCDTVSIEPIFQGYLKALAAPFVGLAEDVTEENLQARVRGTLLMAYANKLGGLVLTTGNKSEVAVGYCTLYGDMNGGLGPISDLYKTEVYALAKHLNACMPNAPIPTATINKAPSAELRAGQEDADSLPPYETLDAILRGHIEEGLSVDELINYGFDRELVRKLTTMVAGSEYKRRQMPQGLRVSSKAFGDGRRLPVAQKYGS